MRPSPKPTAAFTASSAAVPPTSTPGRASASDRSADMPTEMKKNPSSSPSNGAMSASSSWRYSDSDSSTPAMNAPSDGDSPPSVASVAAPTTISKRDRGEHLRRLRPADRAEQRAQQEAPADQDHRDRRHRARHVAPRHMIRQRRARQQRHQCHQRNERQVLEQQHREAVAAGTAGQQLALGQHGQHDRGGRQRQPGAQHHRARPAQAGPAVADKIRQARQCRGADHQAARCQGRTPRGASPTGAAAAAPARSGTAASPRRGRRSRRSRRHR